MRIVLFLCAALVLGAAAGPVKEMTDIQQNIQPEEKPDELLAEVTGEVEKKEDEPTVKEDDKTRDDVSRSRNTCPSGWSQYGSRCFIFIQREMVWIDAEKYCLRNGANLVSIHSSGEYQFIQEVVRGSTGRLLQAWIGGTDAIRDRTWLWTDGSGLHFQHWGMDEPNNAHGNERCLEMNRAEDYMWNDMPCELELPFVCGTRP